MIINSILRRLRLWYAAMELRELFAWNERDKADWQRHGRKK